MANHLTSAYGGDRLTVSEMMKDPTFIPQIVLDELDGAFMEEAIFRNGGTNEGVVAYREAAAPYLNDDAEDVAEFAEIPVSDLNTGKLKSIIGLKNGLAVRVSREMVKFNKSDMLGQQVTALKNTMVRNGIRATLAGFEASGIQPLAVSTDWETTGADPMRDLRQAKRLISKARPDDRPEDLDALYGYSADTLVANPATIDLALFHESVQKFYNGNAAVDNPAFTGVTPQTIANLRVITSEFIPEGVAYVMQSGTAGFISEADPLTVTEMYSESGENGFGGSRQSWRTDAFRNRIIAVDNPKAVVKITGIEA